MYFDGMDSASVRLAMARGRKRLHRLARAVVLIMTVVSLSACASSTGGADGTWRANYFVNSDSVWNAIELSLIDVNYAVIEKNRFEGTIRAESPSDEDGTVIVLDINQVVYTDDQVNVYVRPSIAHGAASAQTALLKAAGDRFMATLDAKLKP